MKNLNGSKNFMSWNLITNVSVVTLFTDMCFVLCNYLFNLAKWLCLGVISTLILLMRMKDFSHYKASICDLMEKIRKLDPMRANYYKALGMFLIYSYLKKKIRFPVKFCFLEVC